MALFWAAIRRDSGSFSTWEIVLNSINILGFISNKPKKLSSSNCQADKVGREMYKNKGDKKGVGEANFCYQKEKCVNIS